MNGYYSAVISMDSVGCKLLGAAVLGLLTILVSFSMLGRNKGVPFHAIKASIPEAEPTTVVTVFSDGDFSLTSSGNQTGYNPPFAWAFCGIDARCKPSDAALASSLAQAGTSVNAKVVSYAYQNFGVSVWHGECWDLAFRALQFAGTDSLFFRLPFNRLHSRAII